MFNHKEVYTRAEQKPAFTQISKAAKEPASPELSYADIVQFVGKEVIVTLRSCQGETMPYLVYVDRIIREIDPHTNTADYSIHGKNRIYSGRQVIIESPFFTSIREIKSIREQTNYIQ